MKYTELTKHYSEDYFDVPTKRTIQQALLLIESIKNGSFEYDTYTTNNILTALKYAVNEIDI